MKLIGTGRQTDRQADAQDHVLSQADALTKNKTNSASIEVEIELKSLTTITAFTVMIK